MINLSQIGEPESTKPIVPEQASPKTRNTIRTSLLFGFGKFVPKTMLEIFGFEIVPLDSEIPVGYKSYVFVDPKSGVTYRAQCNCANGATERGAYMVASKPIKVLLSLLIRTA